MSRTRKTLEDNAVNQRIGDRLAKLRGERGWSLRHLSDRLGLSVAYLNALESGKHAFSATLLLKLSGLLEEPVGALIGSEPPRDDLHREWSMVFDTLQRRDRLVVLDLARKLASWSETFKLQTTRRTRQHRGRLVSLEGIDGVLLRRVAEEIVVRLPSEHSSRWIPYDHQSTLWGHMRDRFRMHAQGSSPLSFALERTLLFACERLQRQEVAIRPALAEDMLVLTPFFSMAPSVYQEADGVGDRRVIEIIESLLAPPDLMVIIYSPPDQAARGATLDVPNDDQFYSPYCHIEDFERAQSMHHKACDEFTSRGYLVQEVELFDVDRQLSTAADRIVEALSGG